MAELDRARLARQLEDHEGKRRKAYRDSVGVLTIGIGHNLEKPISERAVAVIFEDDVEEVVGELDRVVPWWRGLSGIRQLVLADMMFNLGASRLLKFRNTLPAMQEGRWADAAAGMRKSLWAKQTGRRARRLATMMETDVDPGL